MKLNCTIPRIQGYKIFEVKRIRTGLLMLTAFALVLTIISLALPSKYRVEREIFIQSRPEAIYPLLNSMKKWEEWTVFNQGKDPGIIIQQYGAPRGIGSKMTYEGERLGRGTIEIIDSEVDHLLQFQLLLNNKIPSKGSILLEPSPTGTYVLLVLEGDVGFHIPDRFIIRTFNGILGPLMEESLFSLKEKLEKH